MPLPLGHTAIGLATYELCSKNQRVPDKFILAVFIAILANLPDMDIVIGLIFKGNGNAFHRGPTHSLIFAIVMGYLASNAWRLWSQIPRMHFKNCFLLILSHIAADFFFTSSPISFFWPIELNWAAGYSGWRDIVVPVFMEAYRDAGIIVVCGVTLILSRVIARTRHFVPARVLNRGKVDEGV
jgi:membrane-bound metal-dependent hydrolase YbcI (DUF457 family)